MAERPRPSSSQISDRSPVQTVLPTDWEMPENEAYSLFCDHLAAELVALEDRFRAFSTRNSIAGSLSR